MNIECKKYYNATESFKEQENLVNSICDSLLYGNEKDFNNSIDIEKKYFRYHFMLNNQTFMGTEFMVTEWTTKKWEELFWPENYHEVVLQKTEVKLCK